MYLVKSIIETLTDFTILSESEIKIHVGKARRDYGTTNNTLRRLCSHGVLNRTVGVSASTGIPSWQYRLKMSRQELANYISKKEAAAAAYKAKKQQRDYYYFGEDYGISATADGPIFVGHGLAPDGLEGRCIIVNTNSWQMETVDLGSGYTMLKFKKR